MTAFLVFAHCWAFIQAVSDSASWLLQHHFLGFSSCSLAWFVSLRNIATKEFCSLAFNRKSAHIQLHLCHLRHKLHVLDMNISIAHSFFSSETLFKILGFFMPAKTWLWLTYLYGRTTPHSFLLLLCLPYLYSSIVLFVCLTIFIAELLPLWSRYLFILIYLALWGLLRD